jgi:hypothetical protein
MLLFLICLFRFPRCRGNIFEQGGPIKTKHPWLSAPLNHTTKKDVSLLLFLSIFNNAVNFKTGRLSIIIKNCTTLLKSAYTTYSLYGKLTKGTAERNFYVYNGFVIYVTRSHKAKRSTNR